MPENPDIRGLRHTTAPSHRARPSRVPDTAHIRGLRHTTPFTGGAACNRRSVGYAAPPPMLTSQPMPNLSVTMPNSSPHTCFSRGMVTVPPSLRPSQ